MLVTLKGLPLAYNKDMQEDKEGLFDAVHTLKGSLRIFKGMLDTMTVNTSRLSSTIRKDFSNATELADYLVGKGIPFREAHEIVGKVVLWSIQNNLYLLDVPIDVYQSYHPMIEHDIYNYLQPDEAVKRRQSYGGTSQKAVSQQIEKAQSLLESS